MKYGRDDWIRTSDPLTPSQVRYQTAPHPDPQLYQSDFVDFSPRADINSTGLYVGPSDAQKLLHLGTLSQSRQSGLFYHSSDDLQNPFADQTPST